MKNSDSSIKTSLLDNSKKSNWKQEAELRKKFHAENKHREKDMIKNIAKALTVGGYDDSFYKARRFYFAL